MDEILKFNNEVKKRIENFSKDKKLKKAGYEWLKESMLKKYVYNFSWMGRPIIQTPQDIIAMQEIIWKVKPHLIIETGIAHGGSIIYYASLLEMMNIDGMVLGIDIDIRRHNKKEIESHIMYKKIKMIEGSSTSVKIAEQVRKIADGKERILVVLDSNHTHKHVLKEMKLYSKFVSKDSYLVVFDTIVEDLPSEFSSNRPWDIGNNPKTAVKEFLKHDKRFIIDKEIENKLLITAATDGYLKKIKP